MWKARGRGNDYRNLSPRRVPEIASVLPQFPPANEASKLERSFFSEFSASKRSVKDRKEIRSRVNGKSAVFVEVAAGLGAGRKRERVGDRGRSRRRCGLGVNHDWSVAAVERRVWQIPVGRNHDHEHDDEHSQQEQHARPFYRPLRHQRVLWASSRRKSTPKTPAGGRSRPVRRRRHRVFGGSGGVAVQYRSLLWERLSYQSAHTRETQIVVPQAENAR
jgi:hypothetical protein